MFSNFAVVDLIEWGDVDVSVQGLVSKVQHKLEIIQTANDIKHIIHPRCTCIRNDKMQRLQKISAFITPLILSVHCPIYPPLIVYSTCFNGKRE